MKDVLMLTTSFKIAKTTMRALGIVCSDKRIKKQDIVTRALNEFILKNYSDSIPENLKSDIVEYVNSYKEN